MHTKKDKHLPPELEFLFEIRVFIFLVSRAGFNFVTQTTGSDILHTISHIICVCLSKCISSQIYPDMFKTKVFQNKLYTFKCHTFCYFLFSAPYCCSLLYLIPVNSTEFTLYLTSFNEQFENHSLQSHDQAYTHFLDHR